MAKFVTPRQEPSNKSKEAVEPQPTATPHSEVAAVEVTSKNPDMQLDFPGKPKDEDNDAPGKYGDDVVNSHAFRVSGKRRFQMDALCRALNCEHYLLDSDKQWAPNPLKRGPKVSIRYTREFPSIKVVYDKYDLVPPREMVEFKKSLAQQHGYRYLYETPEEVMTHELLSKQLQGQKS